MAEVRWERYPQVAGHEAARTWLRITANLGRAANTIDAYGRALDDYLLFSSERQIDILSATRDHVAAYVNDLHSRSCPKPQNVVVIDTGAGLANATLQQRLTAVRLFYDFLVEEGRRQSNPVGRGRYTPGRCFGGRERGLVPRYTKLPWIPNDEQWKAIVSAARIEPFRNRIMLALAYDAALRREELCSVETGDIDPSQRTVSIRAENTKSRRGRVVPYSEETAALLVAYLHERRRFGVSRGPLFLSESRRNPGRPISIWSWSKVVERLSDRSAVSEFKTHTTRHLRLTDLARANWDIQEIATFAGHRSVESTLLYVHLSGRELAAKLARGMAGIHEWRIRTLAEIAHD
jgi:site-specific recombinase XerD